jgi:anaerobic magnesium-protoporphyrin IX monomethyl ester cyclase
MRLLLIEANDMARWVGGRVGPRVHVVPVALLGLAATVRGRAEVRVIESSLDAPDDTTLERVLEDFRPDLVGVRSIAFFVGETRRIVAAVRRWSSVPVVVGGPVVSDELFGVAPEIELAVLGEGEAALGALVDGAPLERVPGLLRRVGDAVVTNAPAPPIADLDTLPWPDLSLVDLGRYARHLSYAYNHRRQGVLLTSRGCPYHCTYCFQLPNTPVRLRSARHVLGEIIDLAERHDVRDFYVVDDVFNLSRRRSLEIFRLIRDARIGARLYFVNGLRVDRCDAEFIDAMLEAGTVWVTFGIESAHPRVAASIKKEIDLDQARETIARVQQSGIVVNVDTMFGFPTETAEEARATLDWLDALPRPSLLPYHFNLRGYPGCEVVDQAVAAGMDRAAFLATGQQSYHDLPIGTPSFSRREMLEHLVEYHRRLGLSNRDHVRESVATLRHVGYSDAEIVDLYTVLMNRVVGSVAELE